MELWLLRDTECSMRGMPAVWAPSFSRSSIFRLMMISIEERMYSNTTKQSLVSSLSLSFYKSCSSTFSS